MCVSIVAMDQPSAPKLTATRLVEHCASNTAKAVAMAGLRKNLRVSNPSMGASFHAPPSAQIQPPMEPSAINANIDGAAPSGCRAASMAATAATAAT